MTIIDQPLLIREYNQWTGGVDLFYKQLQNLGRCKEIVLAVAYKLIRCSNGKCMVTKSFMRKT